MTKQFSLLQLFSLIDGRLSTSILDVYDMLNHIHNASIYTHEIPKAFDRLIEANPSWIGVVRNTYYSLGCTRDTDFNTCISILTENNEMVNIPQL